MASWAELAGPNRGAAYLARFARLEASGVEVHGEASFCAEIVAPGARILDAGCGTGRVAIRLAELGYRCVGVDVDEAMLDQARLAAPELTWLASDLAQLNDTELGSFRLVIAAGNVIPLLDPGTQPAVLSNLASVLTTDGLLVTGWLGFSSPPAGLSTVHPR